MKMCDWLTFILFVSDDNLHLQFIPVIVCVYYLPSLNGINVFCTLWGEECMCMPRVGLRECGWNGVNWSVARFERGCWQISIHLRCPLDVNRSLCNEWNVNNELPKINGNLSSIQLTRCCHTQTWLIHSLANIIRRQTPKNILVVIDLWRA